MHVIRLLSVIALPLVTGMPNPFSAFFPKARHQEAHRWTDVSLAQFNFQPYVLSDACFDCTRPNTTTLFSCSIKCKCGSSLETRASTTTA